MDAYKIKLSENFKLYEFLKSGTALRKDIKEQFNPSVEVIENIELLCQRVLQPIRSYLNTPLKINSGYRCLALNKTIGGAKNSQHLKGEAADIDLTYKGFNDNGLLYKTIFDLKNKGIIEFDQCILEFGSDSNPSWIHISYSSVKNRNQILRAKKEKGKTIYIDITKKHLL